MTGHVIWPEGLPGKARRTTSGKVACLVLISMRIGALLPISKARRIRHSRCEEGMPIPHVVEAALEDVGAIAPPGGWPRPRPAVNEAEGPLCGDVRTITHSII